MLSKRYEFTEFDRTVELDYMCMVIEVQQWLSPSNWNTNRIMLSWMLYFNIGLN